MTKIQDNFFALLQATRMGAVAGGEGMTKWQDSHFALLQAARMVAVQGGTA